MCYRDGSQELGSVLLVGLSFEHMLFERLVTYASIKGIQ